MALLPKPPSKPRLLTMRTPTKLPRGPKLYRPAEDRPRGGPGEPPAGFIGGAAATNSTYEWWVYWALAKIFKNPESPRVGPFVGGPPEWVYQKAVLPQGAGSAVIDFIVYGHGRGAKPIALRVVTEAWHLFKDSHQQAIDQLQREAVESYANVVDLLDYTFIHDPTGQAVIVVTKNALGMLERANPLLAGTAIRGSRLRR